MADHVPDLLAALCVDLGVAPRGLTITGSGQLPSVFAVTDLAVASIGVAGQALAELMATTSGECPEVTVDCALASQWFGTSISAVGWEPPSPWDALAGDYEAADGWIRLHTNAPRHRLAALAALGVDADRRAVAAAVSTWPVDELEAAVVAAGGAAAAMRTRSEWAAHPQGIAVGRDPLTHQERTSVAPGGGPPRSHAGRPLAGLRVLDMTRVLAGPTATRLLAGWGADVLRVDPPDWDEPAVAFEMTLGKHCTRLDLTQPADRRRWEELLGEADVLVHGYRPGALDALGLTPERRDELRPGLVEVCLDAYGWAGPWQGRRGFDSLVQMSSGIAAAGREAAGSDRPLPLPVQALDHATGYLMAAAALRGLLVRERDGVGSRWRCSLARTAKLLIDQGLVERVDEPLQPGPAAGEPTAEATGWGPALRLPPPVTVAGARLSWSRPARPLGYDAAAWSA